MLVIFSFSMEEKKSYIGLELLPAPLKMNDLLRFKSMDCLGTGGNDQPERVGLMMK